MEPMAADAAKDMFTSARLCYEAVEPGSEEVKSFLLDNLLRNPVDNALSHGFVLRPRGKGDADKLLEDLNRGLLSVLICLPGQPQDEGDLASGVVPDSKPVPIGFMRLSESAPGWHHHRSSSIMLSIDAAHQNKGYGREALNWLVDWGFRHGNLHRIGIGAVEFNARAVELYESVGFKYEGRIRESVWFNRKWYDQVQLSMLEREWEALRSVEQRPQ